jgi:transcription elongation factor GreA
MKKRIILTKEGREELERELADLVERRPGIIERIATAREYGDLSENEDYSAARNEQKVVEGRILEIEGILKSAETMRAGKREKVALGAKVEVRAKGKEQEFLMVGAMEANPLAGKVSDESPLGRALMGKRVGDEAALVTAKGEIVYKIVAIS